MLVHIFQCSDSGLHCATRDLSPDRLPQAPSGGEWRYVRDVQLERGDGRIAIDSARALADIEEAGYHLLDGWYARL
jgi:hypothetical protein